VAGRGPGPRGPHTINTSATRVTVVWRNHIDVVLSNTGSSA
jgi:hypothetical protein